MKRYVWLVVLILIVIIWIIIDGYSTALKPHPLHVSQPSTDQHGAKPINSSNPVSSLFHRVFKKRSLVDKLERLGRSQELVANNLKQSNQELTSYESRGLVAGSSDDEATYQESSSESDAWVYISEYGTNQVSKCKISGQLALSNCEVVLNNLLGPENIVIVGDILYVVNINQPVLQMCKLDVSGDVTSCNKIELPLPYPLYLAYYNHQLFISDGAVKNAVTCNLDNRGIVLNCNKVNSAVVRGVVNIAYWGNYSYSVGTTHMVSQILKCSNTICSNIIDSSISGPTSIQVQNNSAYITNYNTNTLVSCGIKNNGDFTNCKILKSGFASPVDVAFYSYVAPLPQIISAKTSITGQAQN